MKHAGHNNPLAAPHVAHSTITQLSLDRTGHKAGYFFTAKPMMDTENQMAPAVTINAFRCSLNGP